jgi:hypothetical protein
MTFVLHEKSEVRVLVAALCSEQIPEMPLLLCGAGRPWILLTDLCMMCSLLRPKLVTRLSDIARLVRFRKVRRPHREWAGFKLWGTFISKSTRQTHQQFQNHAKRGFIAFYRGGPFELGLSLVALASYWLLNTAP